MKNVIFARPSYSSVEDDRVEDSHLLAIMHGSNHGGIRWAGVATPRKLGWKTARNVIYKLALSMPGVDGVIWVDDDMVVPQEAFSRLVSYDLDLVSGLYFQRLPPHWPVMGIWNGKLFNWFTTYPQNALAPVDAVGFGCCYTSLNLLRKLDADPEAKRNKEWPFGGDWNGDAFGEDFLFCLRAAKVGVRPHIDTALKCEHGPSGRVYAQEADFLRYKSGLAIGPEIQEEKSNGGVRSQRQKNNGGVHQDEAGRANGLLS